MRISDWSSDVCSSDLGSLKAPQVEIDQGGDGEVFDQVIELLIALRRYASRLIDTVVAVHCLAHISEVRSATGDRLEAAELGMRDCLAGGHEKGRAVVRKNTSALRSEGGRVGREWERTGI